MSAADSPAASASEMQDRHGEVSYRFCQECANLLHPKEDRDTKELLFVCSSCNSSERHDVACTYRNKLETAAEETAGVTADVASDPTLPRAHKVCPKCHQAEAVFFQSQQRSHDTGMKLYYVCVHCGHTYSS